MKTVSMVNAFYGTEETMHPTLSLEIQNNIAYYKNLEYRIWQIVSPILLVSGTIGNTLSALVMMRKAMRRSTLGLMLIVLALCDTLVLWTDLLRQWLRYVYDIDLRTYSNVVCKVYRFFIFWNGQCSGWIITIMSVERFFAIFLPIQTKYWTSRTKIAIIFLIIATLLAALNLHFFWTYELQGSYCSAVDKYHTFLTVYWPWINWAFYSVIPFTILICTSTAIILKIVHSNYIRKHNMNQKEGVKLTSITLTLLCVSFMFVLTTGPVAVYRITQNNWIGVTYTPEEKAFHDFLWAVIMSVTFLNNTCNFILYILTASTFREQLISLFTTKKPDVLKTWGSSIEMS